MDALIEPKRDELARLCQTYRVRHLALFGSATGDGFRADSDLDFAVEFEALTPREHKACYFGLLAALQALFGREVDLVEYGPIRNPYFMRSLLASRVVLYEAA